MKEEDGKRRVEDEDEDEEARLCRKLDFLLCDAVAPGRAANEAAAACAACEIIIGEGHAKRGDDAVEEQPAEAASFC